MHYGLAQGCVYGRLFFPCNVFLQYLLPLFLQLLGDPRTARNGGQTPLPPQNGTEQGNDAPPPPLPLVPLAPKLD